MEVIVLLLLYHLAPSPEPVGPKVEEEDDGEGWRQDGVVVQVLPPDRGPGMAYAYTSIKPLKTQDALKPLNA